MPSAMPSAPPSNLLDYNISTALATCFWFFIRTSEKEEKILAYHYRRVGTSIQFGMIPTLERKGLHSPRTIRFRRF